jgi:hypothetical protein
MHTPAVLGVDEIELAAINLNDSEPEVDLDTPMDAVERKPSCQPRPRLPPPQAPNGFGIVPKEIADLEVHQSAPGTPVRTERTLPQQQQQQQQHLQQGRSLSVPPQEHRFLLNALVPPLMPSRSLDLDLAGLSGALQPR